MGGATVTRPSTEVRDRKIYKEYIRGIQPKKIAEHFNVTVWVVYMAVRRMSLKIIMAQLIKN